jgi:hypothetical protein
MDQGEIHKQLRLVVFRDAEVAATKNGGSVFNVGIPDLVKLNSEYKSLSDAQKKIVSNKLYGFKKLTKKTYRRLEEEYQEQKGCLQSLAALIVRLTMNNAETDHDGMDTDFETESPSFDPAGDYPEGSRVRFPESILRNGATQSPVRSPTRSSVKSPPRSTTRLTPNVNGLTADLAALRFSVQPVEGTLEDPFILFANVGKANLEFIIYKTYLKDEARAKYVHKKTITACANVLYCVHRVLPVRYSQFAPLFLFFKKGL